MGSADQKIKIWRKDSKARSGWELEAEWKVSWMEDGIVCVKRALTRHLITPSLSRLMTHPSFVSHGLIPSLVLY